ncbi:copper amine oxidase N-terminal domain-containing protein [Schinkia azotoformans]|uniref:copper amine oxidase N-terminal domain-containing protein n=1 Tax=Schinkia azotoformans TaxID=1454 RepID=UPI002DBDC804|nr:copper amine oxidase N-terminal domain-containing protein [Schinkia azotoformans]MEC1780082.1 copper amine oxidase N-terminal domain-containing protein [Schinkia azotoformans]MED4330839.1 copper amine oxidase N-terminal domain-containing protein [Schinkia azotoformans]
MKLKVLLISIALMLSFSLGAFAQSKVNIMFNGKIIDTQAKLIDGITYVPLRVISQMFGANVGWDDTTSTVKITSGTNQSNNTGTPKPLPTQPVKEEMKVYNLGETITFKDVQIKINSVKEDNEFYEFVPSDGEVFKIINMSIKVDKQPTDSLNWYTNHFVSHAILDTGQRIVQLFTNDKGGKVTIGSWQDREVVVRVNEGNEIESITLVNPFDYKEKAEVKF